MSTRMRDPLFWSRAAQLVKTVVAAVLAYELALHVFSLEQPFLAPWSALLTVHATVYRTFRRGAQQVGAAVLGVLLAFVAGTALGVGALSLGVVLLVGLVAGTVRGLRAESTTAATTALVVLLAGYSGDSAMLIDRLADTAIGIGLGLLVNLLLWAPIGDRGAARRVDAVDDRLGDLLCAMAGRLREGEVDEDGLDEWVEETREIDREIEEAWATVRQARESARMNPRRGVSERAAMAAEFERILRRLEQANADIRSMVRTIAIAGTSPDRWDADFVAPWLRALRGAGQAIQAADGDAVARVRDDLRALAVELGPRLEGDDWPVYGALLVNLRNIVEAMTEVAAANPVRPAVARA